MNESEFRQLDIETFCQILSVCLDERSQWVPPLKFFQKQMKDLKDTGRNIWKDDLNTFIDVSVPMVLRQVLNLNVTRAYESDVVNFLKDALLFCEDQLKKHRFEYFTYMASLFDVAQEFYTYAGRIDTSVFSQHLLTMASEFRNHRDGQLLVSLLPIVPDGFLATASKVLEMVAVVIGVDAALPDKQPLIQACVQVFERFGRNARADRKSVNLQAILEFLGNISELIQDHDRRINDVLKSVIRSLLEESTTADVKIAAKRMCVFLYNQMMTKQQREESLDLLAYAIEKSDNFESLQIMKTILTKLAQEGSITPLILQKLWSSVLEQPATMQQKALELFCDVALACHKCRDVVNVVKGPLALLALGRLVSGYEFVYDVGTCLLLDSSGISELIKAANSADLRSLVPEILQKMEDPSVTVKCMELINAILSRYPDALEATPVFEKVLVVVDRLDTVKEMINQLAMIAQRTHASLTIDYFKGLYDKCSSERAYLIEKLFPEDPLIDTQCEEFLAEALQGSEIKEFEIIEHLYLSLCTGRNSVLREPVTNCLWEMILHPVNEALYAKAVQLLLTIRDMSSMPLTLCNFVSKCLEVLESEENRNVAKFMRKCLDCADDWLEPTAIGMIPHRPPIVENFVTVHCQAPDGFVHDITSNSWGTVQRLISNVAVVMNVDATSVALYSHGEYVSPALIVRDVIGSDPLFQVRFRNQYEKAPPFTKETHPINLINDRVERLFKLMTSEIAEDVFEILAQCPTPKWFTITDAAELNPKERYLFTYQLQWLSAQISQRPDRKSLEEYLEGLLFSHLSVMNPESIYLIVSMIEPDQADIRLVEDVMVPMCKSREFEWFDQIYPRLWAIVGNLTNQLSFEALETILSMEHPGFHSEAMKSKLIAKQSFPQVWDVFNKAKNRDLLMNGLCQVPIPETHYSVVFETLWPDFEQFNRMAMQIYGQLCEKWPEFPISKVIPVLLDRCILCNGSSWIPSREPFDLLIEIMKQHKDACKPVLEGISETSPIPKNWGYDPSSEVRKIGCGLTNLGATCYVNSIIQQLFNIEPVKKLLIEGKFDDISASVIEPWHVLFTEMEYSDRSCVDMHGFAAKWTGYDGQPLSPTTQEDANEFLTMVFSRFEGVCPELVDLFKGYSETSFSTDKETWKAALRDSFYSQSLELVGQQCVMDSLRVMLLPEQTTYTPAGYDHAIAVQRTSKLVSLPPYLCLQLKRFEYSIETQSRSKIDQRYEFEDEIDLRPFLDDPKEETRYVLLGVVVHDGSADSGHYSSYFRRGHEWCLANDRNVSVVTVQEMKIAAYGGQGSPSAYILIYERLDASQHIISTPLAVDRDLQNRIARDNEILRTEVTYLSQPFAEFIMKLLDIELEPTAPIRYYLNTLSHSTLENLWKDMSQKVGDIDMYSEILCGDVSFIQKIMCECTSKSMRMAFADGIRAVFSKLPSDNDLILVILSQLWDWFPTMLLSWKCSFDLFKIFYDYANLTTDRKDDLQSWDLMTILKQLILEHIANFVAQKKNSVTYDRFCRLCDLTYVIELFRLYEMGTEIMSSRDILKWLVGSDNHSESLVRLAINTKNGTVILTNNITDWSLRPSGYLVADLCKCSDWICPEKWLKSYFSSDSDQNQLVRAIRNRFIEAVDLIRLVTRNEGLVAHLLFSNHAKIRDDFLLHLRRVGNDPGLINAMFTLLHRVVTLSRDLCNSQHLTTEYTNRDSFMAVPFLQWIVDICPKIENLLSHSTKVADCLHRILDQKAIRDEHSISLARIGCEMLKIGEISSGFLADIQTVILKMVPVHPDLDSTLSAYLNAMNGKISTYLNVRNPKETAGAMILLPPGQFGDLLFKCCLTYNKSWIGSRLIAKRYFKDIGKYYSGAAHIVKALSKEIGILGNSIDGPVLIEVVSSCDKSAVDDNAKYLALNVAVALITGLRTLPLAEEERFLSAVELLRRLSIRPDVLSKCLDTLKYCLNVLGNRHVSLNERMVLYRWLLDVLKQIKLAHFEQIYGNLLICKELPIEWSESWIVALFGVMNRCEMPIPGWIQVKAADEMHELLLRVTSLDEVVPVFDGLTPILTDLNRFPIFIHRLYSSGSLQNILTKPQSSKELNDGLKQIFTCVSHDSDAMSSLVTIAREGNNMWCSFVLSLT